MKCVGYHSYNIQQRNESLISYLDPASLVREFTQCCTIILLDHVLVENSVTKALVGAIMWKSSITGFSVGHIIVLTTIAQLSKALLCDS